MIKEVLKVNRWVTKVNEIVIAIVRPTGVPIENALSSLKEMASLIGADYEYIKVTDHMYQEAFAKNAESSFNFNVQGSEKYRDTRKKMAFGNYLCSKTENPDLFALYAAKKISEIRLRKIGNREQVSWLDYDKKVIYVIDSLKRKAELSTLREIYGDSLFIIAVTSPLERRLQNLKKINGLKETEARELMIIDEDELAAGLFKDELKIDIKDECLQNTSSVFQVADLYVQDCGNKDSISGFISLLFKNPHLTPSQDEFFMHLAYSASLKSGDLSRQVGAAIVSKNDELLALGCNDVPAFGGSLQWRGRDDRRDHALGVDANQQVINSMMERISDIIKEEFKDDQEKITKIVGLIEDKSGIKDLTEFGRIIHAEMDALISCARLGRDVKGGRLFTTTFPCHNCTKHIIAAGIKEVVYIEPYPKSSAFLLHWDTVMLDDQNAQPSAKVAYRPFLGVGPRRFPDLYGMKQSLVADLKRKEKSGYGKRTEWVSEKILPRYSLCITTAYSAELLILDYFANLNRKDDVGHEQQEANNS